MKTLTRTETSALQSALNRIDGAGLTQDGEWGEKTQAAFERWAGLSPSPVRDSVAVGTPSERLYRHAEKDLGISEAPGAASHPRIRKAINEAAEWLDDDDSKTAWCGCIMGLWCKEINLPRPSEFFRAASWAAIGKDVPLGEARRGDICVFKRDGGSHVALFHSVAGVRVTVLGGNQSNAVTVASFPIASLRAIRRPS